MSVIESAARAMLEYEAHLRNDDTSNGTQYHGTTADSILTAHSADIHEWAHMASRTIDRATELRGMSATASRIRGQRAKRSDQRTGRRTIPRAQRNAA